MIGKCAILFIFLGDSHKDQILESFIDVVLITTRNSSLVDFDHFSFPLECVSVGIGAIAIQDQFSQPGPSTKVTRKKYPPLILLNFEVE